MKALIIYGARLWSMSIRLSLCFNSGPKQGQSQAAVVLPTADIDILVAVAANKLRIKKKDLARVRLFVWGSGDELPRDEVSAGRLRNGDLIAISLGEAYCGPNRAGSGATKDQVKCTVVAGGADWSKRGTSLAVVEWADAETMNRSLGRLSTLLEHPTLCAPESGRVVSLEEQRQLPSSSYLGHNLYAELIHSFEVLATDASESELAFVRSWRDHGAPEVVISFVVGAQATLSHEMCHARYALDPAYRRACDSAWEAHADHLGKWMRDLGYHHSRHADEFGAYLMTEPATFWRGRISPADVRSLRGGFAPATEWGEPFGVGHTAAKQGSKNDGTDPQDPSHQE